MAVFRVEKNSGYTVMSNHYLRNRALSLKAKGLLSQIRKPRASVRKQLSETKQAASPKKAAARNKQHEMEV